MTTEKTIEKLEAEVAALNALNATLVDQLTYTQWGITTKPENIDFTYVCALSQDMYESGGLFAYAERLQKRGKLGQLVLARGETEQANEIGWIGTDALKGQLAAAGVDISLAKIASSTALHSKSQVVDMVRFAKEHQLASCACITVAYHATRMFPYMVQAMAEERYTVRFYMWVPPMTDWTLPMLAEQGQSTDTCAEAVPKESAKIIEHTEKGWAAPTSAVLDYLRWRDSK